MNYYIILVAFAIGFGSGGYSVNFYWAAKDNARIVKEESIRKEAREIESKIARDVAEQLQETSKNVRTITKWRTKYINRPINSVPCTDNDGLRLIESYSSGGARKLTSQVGNEATKP